jgi:hypothetical protein
MAVANLRAQEEWLGGCDGYPKVFEIKLGWLEVDYMDNVPFPCNARSRMIVQIKARHTCCCEGTIAAQRRQAASFRDTKERTE